MKAFVDLFFSVMLIVLLPIENMGTVVQQNPLMGQQFGQFQPHETRLQSGIQYPRLVQENTYSHTNQKHVQNLAPAFTSFSGKNNQYLRNVYAKENAGGNSNLQHHNYPQYPQYPQNPQYHPMGGYIPAVQQLPHAIPEHYPIPQIARVAPSWPSALYTHIQLQHPTLAQKPQLIDTHFNPLPPKISQPIIAAMAAANVAIAKSTIASINAEAAQANIINVVQQVAIVLAFQTPKLSATTTVPSKTVPTTSARKDAGNTSPFTETTTTSVLSVPSSLNPILVSAIKNLNIIYEDAQKKSKLANDATSNAQDKIGKLINTIQDAVNKLTPSASTFLISTAPSSTTPTSTTPTTPTSTTPTTSTSTTPTTATSASPSPSTTLASKDGVNETTTLKPESNDLTTNASEISTTTSRTPDLLAKVLDTLKKVEALRSSDSNATTASTISSSNTTIPSETTEPTNDNTDGTDVADVADPADAANVVEVDPTE